MASKSPTIAELGAKIADCASTIDAYLKANGIPQPNFSPETVDGLPGAPEVQGARVQALDMLMDLWQLLLGPGDFILNQLLPIAQDQWVIDALGHFGFWTAVPLDGSASYAEIAEKVRLSESMVRRILRHSMSLRIFAPSGDDRIVHTSVSAYCVRKPMVRSFIEHMVEEVGPAAHKVIECLEKYPDSQEPGECPMMVALSPNAPPDKNIFQFFEEDTVDGKKGYRMERFSQLMEYTAGLQRTSQEAMHDGYDWAGLGEATIVDVGGNIGHVSCELASRNPKLSFIVQDMPGLKDRFAAARPAALADRVSFQAHDFFKPQPVKNADAFLFRIILHDWSDTYAIRILRALIPAMRPGVKVIVVDSIMMPPHVAPKCLDRLMDSMDLQMFMTLNAKERSEADWNKLFRDADSRFVIKRINRPVGNIAAFMELVWEEHSSETKL